MKAERTTGVRAARVPIADGEAVRTVSVSGLSIIASTLAVSLVGGLAVFLRRDLQFSEAQLGIVVGVFFGATALFSTPGGWVSERLGARRAVRAAGALSAAVLIGIGLWVSSWGALVAMLAVAGVANGLAQPAANLALARGTPEHKWGLAFGVKQSAIPVATLLSGAAVPGLAMTVGWRWAFIVGGAVVLPVLLIPLRGASLLTGVKVGRAREGDVPMLPLVIIAIASGAAAASAVALGAFIVESSVNSGLAPSMAGNVLAVSSVAGILARMLTGWQADRGSGDHLVVVCMMLVAGSIGFVALGLGDLSPALVVVGGVLGFGAGWGWPGLLFLAVVRENTNAPGAATGIVQTGVASGGILGPLAFGLIVTHAGYRTAWFTTAAVTLLASVLLMVGRTALHRSPSVERRRRPQSPVV